jgi:hypothetical protein
METMARTRLGVNDTETARVYERLRHYILRIRTALGARRRQLDSAHQRQHEER